VEEGVAAGGATSNRRRASPAAKGKSPAAKVLKDANLGVRIDSRGLWEKLVLSIGLSTELLVVMF
jgi:hypothetical protein